VSVCDSETRKAEMMERAEQAVGKGETEQTKGGHGRRTMCFERRR
jgi:hypothetical protein